MDEAFLKDLFHPFFCVGVLRIDFSKRIWKINFLCYNKKGSFFK